MAIIDGSTVDAKFDQFNILQTTYKSVGDHSIRADVLIPKSLAAGKAPLVLRFHGGGFVFGDALHPNSYAPWVLQLASENNAVLVSANYRLFPESNGTDILDDMDDFWTWVMAPGALDTLLSSSGLDAVEIDRSRIITAGESAGGTLSVYTALSHPDEVRACTAQYPFLDVDGAIARKPAPPSKLFAAVPEAVFDEHMAGVGKARAAGGSSVLVSSSLSDQRAALMCSMHAAALIPRFFAQGPGPRERKYLIDKIARPDTKIPRGGIVIVHGRQDDIVLIDGTEQFVARGKAARQGNGDDSIVFVETDGGHIFDVQSTTLDDEGLRHALKHALDTWLS